MNLDAIGTMACIGAGLGFALAVLFQVGQIAFRAVHGVRDGLD